MSYESGNRALTGIDSTTIGAGRDPALKVLARMTKERDNLENDRRVRPYGLGRNRVVLDGPGELPAEAFHPV
jgi:hypothetical protein